MENINTPHGFETMNMAMELSTIIYIYILLANIIWMIWSVKPPKFQGQSIDDEKRAGFPLDVLRSMMKREVPIVSIVVHWREGFPRFSYQGR
jgi:hypothetical protein